MEVLSPSAEAESRLLLKKRGRRLFINASSAGAWALATITVEAPHHAILGLRGESHFVELSAG